MTIANERKVFWGGYVIKEHGEMILTSNKNTWDTNYHLYDRDEEIEYLIDTSDLPEEIPCLFELKDHAFKTYDM